MNAAVMNTSVGVGSEIKAVDEIIHALDVTLDETTVATSDETLTSVRHGAEFLEDHLRRLYRLEESGGLLEIIIFLHPELAHEVDRLHLEHDAIRAEAHRLVLALEDPVKPSEEALHAILGELRHLIANILSHERHERVVMIESINRDGGGEG